MTPLEIARACARKMYADDRASQSLGIEIAIDEPGAATATMVVRQEMINGFGICHGGLVFTLADTAFAFACNAHNALTVAGGGSIEFLQPAVRGDRLRAEARQQFRGDRRGVYEVTVRNQAGDVVALFQGRSVRRGEALLNDE